MILIRESATEESYIVPMYNIKVPVVFDCMMKWLLVLYINLVKPEKKIKVLTSLRLYHLYVCHK